MSTMAGNGTAGSAEGTFEAARFSSPRNTAVDAAGNVYLADTGNHRIRKITPAGVVTTLAGSTTGFADGTGTAAKFSSPEGLAVDSAGNIFVADTGNHRIRRITPAGVVTAFAGSGTAGNTNATGTSARFSSPRDVAVTSAGIVYVADTGNHRIRRITSAGVVSTFAGSNAGATEGTGTGARFNSPKGVAVDASGNVFVADTGNHRIRKVTSAGVTSLLAGSTAGYTNASGGTAKFNLPEDVAVSGTDVYVADTANHTVRKVTAAGAVSTHAGGGTPGLANGLLTAARFNAPAGIAVDSAGNVYVGDTLNHAMRKIGLAPATPSGFSGVSAQTGGSATFTWAPDSDSLTTGYRLYRGGVLVATIAGRSTATYVDVVANGLYSYELSAIDATSGESPRTQSLPVYVGPDVTAPAVPTGLTATAGDTTVELTWAANTDPDLDVYRIYRTGGTVVPPVDVPAGQTMLGAEGLANGTTYTYTISAIDNLGNESAQSAPVTGTPVTAPPVPAGLTASPGDGQVTLSWNAVTSSAAAPVSGYRLFRSGVQVYEGPATSRVVTGLTNGIAYSFTVAAYNGAPARQSAQSAPVASTPVAVPGAPSGLAAVPGNTQVSLSWSPVASTATAPVTGYRLFQDGVQVYQGTATSRVVTGLTNGTAYGFTVAAYGPSGQSAVSGAVTATPIGAPATPGGLAAVAGSTQVSLTWNAVGTTAAAPLTGYRLYQGGILVYDGPATSRVVTGLTNGTVYSFTVAAYGPGGASAQSVAVASTPVAAPGVPGGLAVTAGDGQAAVSWNAVASTADAPVAGYRLYQDGIQVYQGATTSRVVTGLTNGTNYSLTVAAYGPGGASAQSVAVTTQPAAAPPAPVGVAVTADAGQATVSWDPVASTAAAPLTGYRLFRDGVVVYDGPDISRVVTGLTNGVDYAFSVAAYGPGGQSALSSPVSARPITTPAVPTDLFANAGDGAAFLGWSPVEDSLGAPVSGYRLFQDGVVVYDGPDTGWTVFGLTNGVDYTFAVASYGPAGESALSAEVHSTPVTIPAVPTGLAGTAGSGEVTLTWTAVPNSADAPVSGYLVFSGDAVVYDGTATTAVITGLTNGVDYSFSVAAYGPGGQSELSLPVLSRPIGIPATPTGLTGTAGDGQVDVSWSPVADTQAAPLWGYRLYRDGIMIYDGTVSSKVVGSLTNGLDYAFTVVAYGPAGQSPPSTAIIRRPVTSPGVPGGLAGTPGNGQVTLSWFAVTSTAAAPVSGYRLYQGGTLVYDGLATSRLVTGLTNGTAYSFTVVAYGAGGASAQSGTVSATPVVAPATPSGLAGVSEDRRVSLTWNVVTGSASAPVTGYRLYQDGAVVFDGVDTSKVVTGLNNGISYAFTVAAYGSGGQSIASAALNITPYTLAGAPTMTGVTPGNTTLSFTWIPTSNGGSAITGYTWTVTPGGHTGTTTGTSASLGGLINGTSYTVTVRALNAAGAGPASAGMAGTPITAPGTPGIQSVWAGHNQVTVNFAGIASTAAAPVSGYRVYVDGWWHAWTGTSSPAVITGLNPGQWYSFQVSAYGPGGESVRSGSLSALPYRQPDAPWIDGASGGDRTVSTWWHANWDGGNGIGFYRVHFTDSMGGAYFYDQGGCCSFSTAAVPRKVYNFNVQAFNAAGGSAWSNSYSTIAWASTMNLGDWLRMGERIYSPDGWSWEMVMQGDGNLVIYQSGAGAKWAKFDGTFLVLQGDGNLVFVKEGVAVRWSSDTWNGNGHGVQQGYRVLLQNDGNLVIFSQWSGVIWSRYTCQWSC